MIYLRQKLSDPILGQVDQILKMSKLRKLFLFEKLLTRKGRHLNNVD